MSRVWVPVVLPQVPDEYWDRERCMAKRERQRLMGEIEEIRKGRTLVCFLNFDRDSYPPLRDVCDTSFGLDAKEALFRVLKETVAQPSRLDLLLYTRGGDINAVWPMVSLLREFDKDFEVLVPFRCHSAGTLLCLGAKKIVMSPLAELGPIDPSVTNEYNPRMGPRGELTPIGVEDVRAYKEFLTDQMKLSQEQSGCQSLEKSLPVFLERFVSQVHPLALGNVHRSQLQIRSLGLKLLSFHPPKKKAEEVVQELVTGFYSHQHGINREEAARIIGDEKIEAASDELSTAMDRLLREYENNFELRKPFLVDRFLDSGHDPLFWDSVTHLKQGQPRAEVERYALEVAKRESHKMTKPNVLRKVEEADQFVRTGTGEREARIIGGAIESRKWSYLFETKISMSRYSIIPPHIQVALTPGGAVPLVPGLPKDYSMTLHSMAWIRNRGPKGVSL